VPHARIHTSAVAAEFAERAAARFRRIGEAVCSVTVIFRRSIIRISLFNVLTTIPSGIDFTCLLVVV
jgi:hypothetical protein